MRRATFASGVIASLAFVGPAHGEVHVVGISRGTPVYGSTVATGYTGWVIRLVSDSGNISGIDVDTGVHGLYGPMVQRWTSSENDGLYNVMSPSHTAQNLASSAMNFDSHLLLSLGNTLPAVGWREGLGSGAFAPAGSAVPPFGTNTNEVGFGISGRSGYSRSVSAIAYYPAHSPRPPRLGGESHC
jgi:hypothetical protein